MYSRDSYIANYSWWKIWLKLFLDLCFQSGLKFVVIFIWMKETIPSVFKQSVKQSRPSSAFEAEIKLTEIIFAIDGIGGQWQNLAQNVHRQIVWGYENSEGCGFKLPWEDVKICNKRDDLMHKFFMVENWHKDLENVRMQQETESLWTFLKYRVGKPPRRNC